MGRVEEAQMLMKKVEDMEREREKERNSLMYMGSRVKWNAFLAC